jgi:hypothetical protein
MAKDANASQDGLGLNLIRAVSEAIHTAVAKILAEDEDHPAGAYRSRLQP